MADVERKSQALICNQWTFTPCERGLELAVRACAHASGIYTGLLGCKTKIFWVLTRGGGAYRSLSGHVCVNGSDPYHLLTFPSRTNPFLCSHPAPRASVSASSLALPMERSRECVFLTLVSSFILETFTSGDQLSKCSARNTIVCHQSIWPIQVLHFTVCLGVSSTSKHLNTLLEVG